MSGFNSVDDFYDVMAGRHGLHESEQSGSTLELYSCNGAEFPDGLDGCSLDVITAPSPEFLALKALDLELWYTDLSLTLSR